MPESVLMPAPVSTSRRGWVRMNSTRSIWGSVRGIGLGLPCILVSAFRRLVLIVLASSTKATQVVSIPLDSMWDILSQPKAVRTLTVSAGRDSTLLIFQPKIIFERYSPDQPYLLHLAAKLSFAPWCCLSTLSVARLNRWWKPPSVWVVVLRNGYVPWSAPASKKRITPFLNNCVRQSHSGWTVTCSYMRSNSNHITDF